MVENKMILGDDDIHNIYTSSSSSATIEPLAHTEPMAPMAAAATAAHLEPFEVLLSTIPEMPLTCEEEKEESPLNRLIRVMNEYPALCEKTPEPPPNPVSVSMFAKQYVPRTLERMFGQEAAVKRALEWYNKGYWRKKPLVVWGPSGVGKTLLCKLLASAFQASCATFEDENDVKDKLKGWLQGSRTEGMGLLAFTKESHEQSWMLLDDYDSIEGECRKGILPMIKPYMDAKSTLKFPAPLLITCENLHDKRMSALKAMPHTLQLYSHSVDNLIRLANAVASTLSRGKHFQLATLACGDARRLIMEARFALALGNVPRFQKQDEVYHSPFDAVKSLLKSPAVCSRALDGQEFMVQNLMYQNYPKFNSSMVVVSEVADLFCQLDLLDSEHEFNEYTKLYLKYVVPTTCRARTISDRFRFEMNPKHMKHVFEKPKHSNYLETSFQNPVTKFKWKSVV